VEKCKSEDREHGKPSACSKNPARLARDRPLRWILLGVEKVIDKPDSAARGILHSLRK
jgi:hypothetical protein